jgi:hypothetical protein
MATNYEFLNEKLNNYKKFIRDSGGIPDKCDELDKYNVDVFLAFGASTLLPLKNTSGNVNLAVEKTMEHFKLRDETAIKTKLERYYNFLCDFLNTA